MKASPQGEGGGAHPLRPPPRSTPVSPAAVFRDPLKAAIVEWNLSDLRSFQLFNGRIWNPSQDMTKSCRAQSLEAFAQELSSSVPVVSTVFAFLLVKM